MAHGLGGNEPPLGFSFKKISELHKFSGQHVYRTSLVRRLLEPGDLLRRIVGTRPPPA